MKKIKENLTNQVKSIKWFAVLNLVVLVLLTLKGIFSIGQDIKNYIDRDFEIRLKEYQLRTMTIEKK